MNEPHLPYKTGLDVMQSMHAPELPAPPPVERLAGTQLYIPETAIFNLTMDKMGIKQFHLVCTI